MKSIFKQPIVRTITVLILAVCVFLVLAALAEHYVQPLLPENLQTDAFSLMGSAITTITVLAGLSELTGYSLRDLVSPDVNSQNNTDSTSSHIQIEAGQDLEWSGDILLGNNSKTVVNLGPDASDKTTEDTSQTETSRLAADIQRALYSDNQQLPYVLTLCLDLTHRTGLSDRYDKWLNRELRGFEDYEDFQSEFSDQQTFEEWMSTWASYRLVRPHIKMANYLPEAGRTQMLELPVGPLLVGIPVSGIVRTIENANLRKISEPSWELASVSPQDFRKVQSIVEELSLGASVPPDLRVFFKVAQFEKILDGIRTGVLSLLRDARSTGN